MPLILNPAAAFTQKGLKPSMNGESIFDVIIQGYSSLTRSEIRVADYILKHKPELPYIMSKTLADACQVSEATITRFCRSVGCASFNDFKVRRLRPSPPTAPPARPADMTSMVTSSWRTPWSKNAKSYTASALRPCNRRWTCWITARSARWWTASMRRIMCTASARATLPS